MNHAISIGGLLLAFAAACAPSQADSRPGAGSSTASEAAAPAPSGAAAGAAPSAAASASAAAAPAPDRAPAPRCKAATSGKKAELLATRRELSTHLVLEHGTLFAATFGNVSGEIVAVPVDGSAPRALAPLTQAATGLAVDAAHVYFTQGDALFRIPRGGGEVSRIAEGFGWNVSLDDAWAWGIRFDPKEKVDALVRVPLAGGTPEVVYARKREHTQETFNLSGFYAARSTGSEVILADGGMRVALGVDPKTRETRVLEKDVTYPTGIAFFPGDPPSSKDGAPRGTKSRDGYFVVFSEAGGGLSIGASEHGLFLANSGYMSPMASLGVIRPGQAGSLEVARIPAELSKVSGDDACFYVVGSEARQSVFLAFPIPKEKK